MAQATLTGGEGGGSATSATGSTLYQGSTGEDVRKLQQKLTDLGYDVGGVDADFGPKTAAALAKFQQDAGIDVDAVAGPQTYAALSAASVTKAPALIGTSAQMPQDEVAKTATQTAAQREAERQAAGLGISPDRIDPAYVQEIASGGTSGYTSKVLSSEDTSGTKGYMALKTSNLGKSTGQIQGVSQQAQAPYEGLVREYLAKQPGYTPTSYNDLLARAQEMAQLATSGQRTAIEQGLTEAQRQAGLSRENINAAYAGSEQSVTNALAEARRQATESAISTGGGRSGQVDWFSEKLQQPITTQFAQDQAKRAASLSGIESGLTSAQQQATQQLADLEQYSGLYTNQQLAALRDSEYAKGMQGWQAGLSGAMGLAGLAGNQNQSNAAYALSLLPYLNLTEAERQQFLHDWVAQFGQVPE